MTTKEKTVVAIEELIARYTSDDFTEIRKIGNPRTCPLCNIFYDFKALTSIRRIPIICRGCPVAIDDLATPKPGCSRFDKASYDYLTFEPSFETRTYIYTSDQHTLYFAKKRARAYATLLITVKQLPNSQFTKQGWHQIINLGRVT